MKTEVFSDKYVIYAKNNTNNNHNLTNDLVENNIICSMTESFEGNTQETENG